MLLSRYFEKLVSCFAMKDPMEVGMLSHQGKV